MSNSDFWLPEEKISVSVRCAVCKVLNVHCPCVAKSTGHWCYSGAPSQPGHWQLCLNYTFASALPVPFPVSRGGGGLQTAPLQAAIPAELLSLSGMCKSIKGHSSYQPHFPPILEGHA